MSVTVNLCTRKRPKLLLETARTTLANVVRDDTRFMVSVDSDDQETLAVIDDLPKDSRLIVDVREREDSLGEKYNRALTVAPADIYVAQVDYGPFLTAGFDEEVNRAAMRFPDGIGVVYNDLVTFTFQGMNAVTAGLAAKMGFIFPPLFPFWFWDHWVYDIASYIGRIGYADVRSDNVTKRPRTTGRRDVRFWTVLFEALYLRRQRQALSIIQSDDFMEPTWRKEWLIANFPHTQQRSNMANQSARRASAMDQTPPWPEEEELRYQRIKARALGVMREAVDELKVIRMAAE